MNEPTSANEQPRRRTSAGFRIGVGAALIAVPLGSAAVFVALKAAVDRQGRAEERGAEYDLKPLRQVDPALVKYAQSGQIVTGLEQARGITIDGQGRILLVGDRKVRILNHRGEFLSEMPVAGEPSCLAADEDGTLYVGLSDRVEVYGADGQKRKAWSSFGEKSQITGLTVHGSDVYVSDSGRRVVLRCDVEGRVLAEIGAQEEGIATTGLVLPSPFLHAQGTPQGLVLVNNPGRHRVELYRPDGQLQGFWGRAGTDITSFIGCCNPAQAVLLSDGRIVTVEKGGVPRIKVFSPDGRFDCVVAGPDALGDGMRGFKLAVDRQDRIHVLAPGSSHVRIFTPREGGAS